MPLRAYFYSYDKPGDIYPIGSDKQTGVMEGWIDKSNSPAMFIIAICLGDMGGHFFKTSDAYFTEAGELMVDEYPLDEVRHIPPGCSFQIEIKDYENENGLLVVQHVMSDGTFFTPS